MEKEEPASKRPAECPITLTRGPWQRRRRRRQHWRCSSDLRAQQSAFRCPRNPACIRGFRHGGAPGACKIVDEDTAAAMAQRLADAVMADGEAARSVGKQETRDVPELVD